MTKHQRSMSKHEQWMEFAEAGAGIFARCSRRQYFSVILATDGRVAGTGYNGSPAGHVNCTDGGCPRAATTVAHGSAYDNCTAVHAEANALLHSDRSAREGGTLYVNGPPCWDCTKLIAGSGIATVVHRPDHAYADWAKCLAFLEESGIVVIELANPNQREYADSQMGQRHEVAVDLAPSNRNRSTLADLQRQQQVMGAYTPVPVYGPYFIPSSTQIISKGTT